MYYYVYCIVYCVVYCVVYCIVYYNVYCIVYCTVYCTEYCCVYLYLYMNTVYYSVYYTVYCTVYHSVYCMDRTIWHTRYTILLYECPYIPLYILYILFLFLLLTPPSLLVSFPSDTLLSPTGDFSTDIRTWAAPHSSRDWLWQHIRDDVIAYLDSSLDDGDDGNKVGSGAVRMVMLFIDVEEEEGKRNMNELVGMVAERVNGYEKSSLFYRENDTFMMVVMVCDAF